ncbi:tetraspanin-17-like [Homalodisca vitripennis]|uniref:tetraspanin-17-like n=1 Tax=Homalodisca vitripennis TaxID=197043 RepID=UPI001EEAFC90|nr:tetraspanin-17-like [Homalodisca vitripennis]
MSADPHRTAAVNASANNGLKMPAAHQSVRRYRRDTSEVSCCLKYLIFGFNVVFWLVGLGILSVGVWAWSEKDTFSNLSRLANVALDLAFNVFRTNIS